MVDGDKVKIDKYIPICDSWQCFVVAVLLCLVLVPIQPNSTNIYDSDSVLCDSNTEIINI